MTRINTNVSSLIAQKTLSRSNTDLQTSLTRLSTGLRINTGKDDPAGLIASENLRRDITSIEKAISNSERANQLIGTADSALGQVSSLLNDIRGLVVEAANSGALSDEQIAANQLQVDSSLEALNRIAQTTTFQGRRILDGNFEFTTTAGANFDRIADLDIQQANLGANGALDVEIEVSSLATQAKLSTTVGAVSPGSAASSSVDLSDIDPGTKAETPVIDFNGGAQLRISSTDPGTAGNGYTVQIVDDDGVANPEVAVDDTAKTITIRASGGAVDVEDIASAFDSVAAFEAEVVTDANIDVDTDFSTLTTLAETGGGVKATSGTLTFAGGGQISIEADTAGEEFNDFAIIVQDDDGVASNDAEVDVDTDNKQIVIRTNGTAVTQANIKAAIDGTGQFTATIVTNTNFDSDSNPGPTPLGSTAGGIDPVLGRDAAGSFTIDTIDSTDAFNDYTVEIVDDPNVANDDIVAELDDANKRILFRVDGDSSSLSVQQFADAINDNANLNSIFVAGNVTGNDVDATATDTTITTNAGQIGEAAFDGGINPATAGAKGTLAADLSTVDAGVVGATNDIDLTSIGDGIGGGTIRVETANATDAFNGANVQIIEDDNLTDDTLQVSYDGTDIKIVGDGQVTEQQILDAFATLSDISLVKVGTDALSIDFDDADVTGTQGTPQNLDTIANGREQAGVLNIETVNFNDDFNGLDVQIIQDSALSGTGTDVVAELLKDADGTATALRFRVSDSNSISLADFDAALDASVDTNGIFQVASTSGADLDGSVVGTSNVSLGAVSGGADGPGLSDSVVFQLSGLNGSEVFEFDAGTSGQAIVNAINLVSESVGINAEFDSNTGELSFTTTDFGSKTFADVEVISEGDSGQFQAGFNDVFRSSGSDISATVNGVNATADGFQINLNTATLDFAANIDRNSTPGTIGFTIDGGGAQFQIGPDVVANQQARLGISSVNTAKLGGASGRLFELRSGGTSALDTNPTNAAKIVDEVISKVTGLRGRLGAFQKTTLETNIFTLNDTLANLTEAESAIRDADFAKESAALTRAQILVQSGTSVLGIANNNPQNVLALLR